MDWRRTLVAALIACLWCVPMIGWTARSVTRPYGHVVTNLYHDAVEAWWSRGEVYSGPSGMNYLPQFVPLFTAFHAMGVPWGDIAWRWASVGLLAGGVWGLVRQIRPAGERMPVFLFVSVVALPSCWGALGNAQANATLGGLLTCAAAALAGQRWWASAAWMVLGLMVKPLAVPMMLMTPLGYGKMWTRLAAGGAVFLAMPFAFGPPAYVVSQFEALAKNMCECAAITEDRFASVDGIARALGTELAYATPVRLGAAVAFAAAWFMLARRVTEPVRAMLLLVMSSTYLMLFNPMNEVNSYVIWAPGAACLGAWCVWRARARVTGWALAGFVLAGPVLANVFYPLDKKVGLWLYPVAAGAALAWVSVAAWRGMLSGARQESTSAP